MAYIYTKLSEDEDLYCGEEDDVCYSCNSSLNGKDCIRVDDFFICLDDCSQ